MSEERHIFYDEDEPNISHYGVLGMKWGVRNAETRARYNREGRIVGAISSRLDKRKKAIKDYVARKRNEKQQLKENVAKSGVKNEKQYKEMRKKALTSHDPRTIAENMATLSPDELKYKINQVRLENEMRALVPKSRKERFLDEMANRAPGAIYDIGKNAVTQMVNNTNQRKMSEMNAAIEAGKAAKQHEYNVSLEGFKHQNRIELEEAKAQSKMGGELASRNFVDSSWRNLRNTAQTRNRSVPDEERKRTNKNNNVPRTGRQ